MSFDTEKNCGRQLRGKGCFSVGSGVERLFSPWPTDRSWPKALVLTDLTQLPLKSVAPA